MPIRRGVGFGDMTRRGVGCAVLSAFVCGTLLAGCGSSKETSGTAASVPSSPALVSTQKETGAKVDAVAYVAGAPIPKASYEHWVAVERSLGGESDAGHRALAFLITSQWVVGEATARGIAVSEGQVKERLAQLEKQSFSKSGSLKKFLAKSGESESDLLARVRVEMLQSPIAAKAAAGAKTPSERQAALARFQKSFHAHWKRVTSCLPSYVMEDCKEYKGAPEAGLGPTSSSASSSSGSGSSSNTSSATANPSGEVYSSPGAFAISSPTFARNGQIPAEYTCAGAGKSPALSWEKVPQGASELVLFVIDDGSNSSSGGIRWIVAGIDPSSTGVEAGQIPKGGIVGTNTAGKATYSPICPAPGKSDTIEFVMYALRKPISLKSGFQPALAEHDYGAGKDLLGQAAVTYGIASR